MTPPTTKLVAMTEKHIREIYDLADRLVTQEEVFETTIGPPQVTHDEWVQAMRDIRALASVALGESP